MTAKPQPRAISALDRGVAWAFRHWLALFNMLMGFYVGLPFASPLLKAAGHPLLGAIIFRIYTPLCHQRPERSFFVCGHQVAFCHRCTSFYGGIFLFGMLFSVLRRYLQPARVKIGLLLALPMALDGGSHLIDEVLRLGWRAGGDEIGSLNFWLRMITGVLAALAILVAVYPRLERELPAQAAQIG